MVANGSPAGFVGTFPSKSGKYRDESKTFDCNKNVTTYTELAKFKQFKLAEKSVVFGASGIPNLL